MNTKNIEAMLNNLVVKHAAEMRALKLQNEALYGQIHQLRAEIRRYEGQRQAGVCEACGAVRSAECLPVVEEEERELRKSHRSGLVHENSKKSKAKYEQWMTSGRLCRY